MSYNAPPWPFSNPLTVFTPPYILSLLCHMMHLLTVFTHPWQIIIPVTYRIVGNFGEVFNLANWQFYWKSPNLKSAIFLFWRNLTICICTGICHVAKFKTHQFILGTDSPNLMQRFLWDVHERVQGGGMQPYDLFVSINVWEWIVILTMLNLILWSDLYNKI